MPRLLIIFLVVLFLAAPIGGYRLFTAYLVEDRPPSVDINRSTRCYAISEELEFCGIDVGWVPVGEGSGDARRHMTRNGMRLDIEVFPAAFSHGPEDYITEMQAAMTAKGRLVGPLPAAMQTEVFAEDHSLYEHTKTSDNGLLGAELADSIYSAWAVGPDFGLAVTLSGKPRRRMFDDTGPEELAHAISLFRRR